MVCTFCIFAIPRIPEHLPTELFGFVLISTQLWLIAQVVSGNLYSNRLRPPVRAPPVYFSV
jgi:hypothetical protein